MTDRLISILLFGIFFSVPAHAATSPAPVPQTGQTACYRASGKAVVGCAGTGQDGDVLAGVAWPSPRFVDNTDQTMTDRLTGLAWPRDANPAGGCKSWQQALDYIKILNKGNFLGHNDWRLPNLNELESLVNKGGNLAEWLRSQGFHNLQVDYYWTSSTYASHTGYAWGVSVYGGMLAGRAKTDCSYVWPVRNGTPGVLTLPATGQSTCYDKAGTSIPCAGTGQDGELQAGAPWPRPRFTDNGDLTITDRLTGLVWSRDGKAPGPAVCRPGTIKTWQEALDYVKCLNANSYQGKGDWRLPNRNELASLLNRGQANSAAWLNSLGFFNVEADSYWSSTTYDYAIWNAWRVGMHDGAVGTQAHKHIMNVWPVRSGH